MSQYSLEECEACRKARKFFDQVLAEMKWVQRARLRAEPRHLQARIVHSEAADNDR